jgi:hypothetical protein
MKKCIFILSLLISFTLSGQNKDRKFLPGTYSSLQFAGSTGFITAGVFKGTKDEKLQLGILYGHTPQRFGGPLHSFSFKLIYDPFRFEVSKNVFVDPLQTGFFISQNFGPKLRVTWGDNYPKGYYWWSPGLRTHFFLSSSIGIYTRESEWLDNISCYFEVNTNDLYIASYMNKKNYRSLSFYDIVFFGAGIKLKFKDPKEKK